MRAKQPLQRFSKAEQDFVWFTDEKVFTVSVPKNTQNDCVYAPVNIPKRPSHCTERLLRERPTFSTSVMVSVAVSKLGCTELFLCNLEWKWRVTIIVKHCWRRSCCMHQGNIGWQFHIPTGQCTCTQGTWHNRTFTLRDARLHFSRQVAPKQPRYVPLWL